MRNKYDILNNIKGLNLLDKIILHILKKFTYKIYIKGLVDGFNWNNICY